MKKLLTTLVVCSLLLAMVGCTPKDVRVAERISNSTVRVHIMLTHKKKNEGALCGGVVISPHEILLADHCVDPPDDIKLGKIYIQNYGGRTQEATIEAKDHMVDLAVLHVKKAEVPAYLATRIRKGETCWVVGMPLGLRWVASKGVVSGTGLHVSDFLGTFFITDAVVLPGSSGGGVWNEDGELIGIVSMTTSLAGPIGASGLGIIVDLNTILDFLYT